MDKAVRLSVTDAKIMNAKNHPAIAMVVSMDITNTHPGHVINVAKTVQNVLTILIVLNVSWVSTELNVKSHALGAQMEHAIKIPELVLLVAKVVIIVTIRLDTACNAMSIAQHVPILIHVPVVSKDFICRRNLNVNLAQNTAKMDMFAIVQTVIVRKGVRTRGLENSVLTGVHKDARNAVKITSLSVEFAIKDGLERVVKRTAAQDANLEVQVQNRYAAKQVDFVKMDVHMVYGVTLVKITAESGCSGGFCNRSTGHCLGSCSFDFFGDMCNEPCSDNCLRSLNDTSTRYCFEENGNCTNACRTGYFGDQCTEGCSKHCKDVDCFRNNGSCINGCLDGYSGRRCDRHSEALRSDEPRPNVAAIGGGVGEAVAVLIIIGIVVCILLYRKRSALSNVKDHENADKKTNQSNQRQAFYNLNVIESRDGLNDMEMQPRAANNYYTNEVEIDENDATQHDDTEVNRAVDNTYGNVGGKRVAVENLAEYVKHKSLEEMLNEYGRLPEGLLKPFGEARRPQNALKNKYRAIYPYDENRVVLFGDDGNDYMNASYIDGYNRSREYIASSGPFQRSYDTTPDFWRMIVQEKCETIVMLTNLYEEGQPKCVKYWPDADESCQYGEINITCLTEDVYADFTIRVLAVEKGEKSNNIHHIHFTAWPDKGIPNDVTSMIELRQKVRSLHQDKESPIVVHCSAGIGRTGTFIALDMLSYEGENRGSVDVYDAVTNLRYERCNMVQTAGQYVYLHHAVLHSLTFDCRSLPGDMFLQNYNKLIEKNGGDRIIDKQFQQLQTISDEITEEASEQIERNTSLSKSNRSGADIPADEYRVKLHENRTSGDPDYINAVFVNSYRKRCKFICAQTPLPNTVVDFLSLIYQERCTSIVSMEEPNIHDKTAKVYWPADNQVVKHGVFEVRCKESTTTDYYMTKKLKITFNGQKEEESRDVNLYILTNWPKDSPVPKTPDSILKLVKTVDTANRKAEDEHPILIHCRTGAGRSCLYCAVSVLIEKMEIEHEVSVFNTLRQIKARRLAAFSSEEQFKFCYQAVISYLQSFDIYSNFSLREKGKETQRNDV